jgi:hypothetical protein
VPARLLRLAPAAVLVPLAALWAMLARGVDLHPLTVVATAGVLVGLLAVGWRRGVRWSLSHTLLAGLLGWAVLTGLIRPVPRADAFAVIAIGVVALGFALLAALPRVAPWARAAVLTVGAGAGIGLLVERLLGSGRVEGPFGSPNLSATVALLGLALAPARPWGRGATAVAAALCAGGVVASGSRGALVGALAVAMTWLLSTRWRSRWSLAALLLVLAAGAGLTLRLLRDHDPLRYDRVRIWGVALRVCAAEIPWGAGPAGYEDAAVAHNFPREDAFARFGRVPALAESDALQLAATLGLPGLCLALALLTRTLARLGRARPEAVAVCAAVATTSAFNTQLCVAVVAWSAALAVASTLPRERGTRVHPLGPGTWPLAVLTSVLLVVAVVEPAWWLGGSLREALSRVELRLGDKAVADDTLAAAEAVVWRVAGLRPRWSKAWDVLGKTQLRRALMRGEPALARAAASAFQTARAVNPLDPFASFGEAQAWHWLGDRAATVRALRNALALEPRFVGALLLRSMVALEEGDLGSARASLARLEEIRQAARPELFVSHYEHALASADPSLLARVRAAIRETR